MPRRFDEGGSRRQIDRSGPQGELMAPGVRLAVSEQPIGVIILPVTVRAWNGGLRRVAAGLQDRGFATFLAELLSPGETEHGYHNFDFGLLADRLSEATERLSRKEPLADLPIGFFGTSTDAAAMTVAAARPDCTAGALVMCDARPELAAAELPRVRAPTLFLVKDDDELALHLNRGALAKLSCPCDLTVLPGAGGLDSRRRASQAAELAADWFETHLLRGEQSG